MDIIITIPRSTNWVVYEKELKRAELGEIMNFKVSTFPREANIGDRCYVIL